MKTRGLALILLLVAGIVWLSAAAVPGWFIACVVIASLVMGLRASRSQKQIERQWFTRWRQRRRGQS